MSFHKLTFAYFLGLCAFGGVACSQDSDEDAPRLSDDPSPQGETDAGDGDERDASPSPSPADAGSTEPPVPPCDEKRMAAIQATLDSVHTTNTDMVAAIKTPSCGVRFFTSGPNQIDAERLQRVGSVSKTYTGGVVLDLVKEGKVSLDDPASRWFTGVPGGDAILVRHFLQHTSGLAECESAQAPDQRLASCFKQPTTSKPGEKFTYRNVNFVALGRIAEKVTGKSMATLLRERISTPLGAPKTFFEGSEAVDGPIAPVRSRDGVPGDYPAAGPSTWGAGNVVATPESVVRWIEAFGSGTFLGTTLDAQVKTTIDAIPGIYPTKYGLAIMELSASNTSGGGAGYGHFGDLLNKTTFTPMIGYHTAAFYFPDKKTTVVTVLDFTPLADLNGDSDTLFKAIKGPFYTVLGTLFGDGS